MRSNLAAVRKKIRRYTPVCTLPFPAESGIERCLSATLIHLTAAYPTGRVGSGVHTLSFGRLCTSGTSDRSIPGDDKVRETRATRFVAVAFCPPCSALLPYGRALSQLSATLVALKLIINRYADASHNM